MPDFLTIKRQHDAAKLKGLISQDSSLADFAKLGALATDDPSYQQVAESPAWKNMIRGWSANVDEAIQSGPIDDWTAEAFGWVGDKFGVTPDASRAAGRELPRQVLNFLPMMAGGAVGGFLGAAGGPAGIAAGAAKGGSIGLGLTSGLSAFDAYGKGGTATDAIIGGVAPYVGGKLSEFGSKAALRSAATPGSFLNRAGFMKGKDLLNPATHTIPGAVAGTTKQVLGETVDTFRDKALGYVAGETLANVGFTGLDIVQQGPDAVLNRDYLFANLASNVPFMAADIPNFTKTRFAWEPVDKALTPTQDQINAEKTRGEVTRESLEAIDNNLAKFQKEAELGVDVGRFIDKNNQVAATMEGHRSAIKLEAESFQNTWNQLRTVNTALPDVLTGIDPKVLMQNPSVIGFDPAKTLVQEYAQKLKQINKVKGGNLSRIAKSDANLDTVMGLVEEDLKLPETLLSTPVAERTVEQYQKALGTKLSDNAVKLIRMKHMEIAQGENFVPEFPKLWEEHNKALTGKFEGSIDDRYELITASLLATGKFPKVVKVQKKAVKKAAREGLTQAEAAKDVTQTLVAEAKVDPLKAAVAARVAAANAAVEPAMPTVEKPKGGRPVGPSKGTVDKNATMEERIVLAGKALKPTDEDRFFIIASQMIDPANRAKGLNWMSKVATEHAPLPLPQKLLKFQSGLKTLDERVEANNQLKTVPLNEEITPDAVAEMETALEEADSAAVPAREEAMRELIVEETARELDEDVPEISQTQQEQNLARDFMVAMAKKVGVEISPADAAVRFANMPFSVREKNLAMAKMWKERGFPQLAAKDIDPLSIHFTTGQPLPIKEFATAWAREAGVPEAEIPATVDDFVRITQMFAAGEARFGKLEGTVSGMQFARNKMLSRFWVKKGLDGYVPTVEVITQAKALVGAEELRAETMRLKAFAELWNMPMEEHEFLERAARDIMSKHDVATETTGEGAQFARASAGAFDFGMREVKNGQLQRPGKPPLGTKDGWMTELDFRNNGGDINGVLTKDEVNFYRELVPEAFADGKVHLQKLWDGLGKVGEQVKVVTYGQDGQVSEAKQQFDRLVHDWFDNLTSAQRYAVSSYDTNDREVSVQHSLDLAKIRQYRELRESVGNERGTGPRATSYYNQISPLKYPVVRVDVVLPVKQLHHTSQDGLPIATTPSGEKIYAASFDKPLWSPDNLHENLPNTLGWAMVQVVPHPVTGEKVMFVGEAQSRWGQAVQKKQAALKSGKVEGEDYEMHPGERAATEAKLKELQHPLLPIHQNLILKAVIKEAQKQGISKVAISGSKEALMTERLDTPGSFEGPFATAELAQVKADALNGNSDTGWKVFNHSTPTEQRWFASDKQGGFDVAYDTTMPSIMKKLVGEGSVEDFGVHKNAQKLNEGTDEAGRARTQELYNQGRISRAEYEDAIARNGVAVTGSPVFRNSDGTPKSNITARVYDVTSPSERVNTLFARKPVPGGQVYAAAIEAKRQIFLNPKALEGLSPLDRVRVLASLLAHESSHILIHKARNGLFGSEAKAIIDNMDLWASSANPHEIEVVVDTLADVFLDKKTRDLPGVADVIKNLRDNSGQMDKDEVLANIYGIWATGLHQLKDPGRFYTFMPKVVRDVYDWIAGKIQGVVRAAQMYVRFGGDQEKLGRVQQVRDVFAAVRKGARQAEENLGELNQLVNLSQTDVFDLADAKFAAGEYGSTGKPGASFMNKIDSWVVRMGSLAATHQGLEKPFRAMVDTMPLIHDIIAQSYAGLGWGDYSYTGLNVKKNSGPARIRDSESLNNTLNKVNVEVQRLMETAVVKNPDGTVEFDLQKLSPELRAEVKQYNPEAQRVLAEYVIKRSEQTMPIVHGTIVAKEWDKQTDNLHKILFRYESMKMDYKLAEQVAYESMQAVRQGDMVKLAEVLKKVPSPVEAAQIGKFVTAMGQRIKNLEADYKKNPAFGSLRRFQPIKQTWTKTGFPDYKMQARNAKDAEAQSARLESEGWTPGIPRIEDFKPTDEWVMDSNSKKRLIDMETRLHESLDELGIPEDVKAELKKDMNFVAMLEEDAAGQSVYSTKVRREFAEGTDRLNALEQDLTFIHAAISGSMKRALDAKVSVAMLNPELNTVKDAKDVFQQGYENFNQSNNPWLSKLSKANAAWFIGMNIPGHVAELLQPVMTHLAEMRNIGLRTGKALGVIMSSNKDITAFYKRNAKKFATGETVHLWDDWKDAEEREMLFEHKHVINANPLNYAFDEMGFQQQQLIAMTDGGKKKSLSELALSPATAYANWSLKFYNLFTRHNAIMGLVGGYRAYRQAGYSHAEAKEKVRLYEVVVNKSGGRADRQAAPFKGNAVLGHLFYGLQGYTTGWFSQALTYARHGYNSKDYIGFKDNPVAAKNARSALHTMLGAQLAASGLIGLPFVGALMTLWEEMMGEDVRGKLYENLEEVTGDPLLAQAASHGVASALAEKLGIPADLHGRFAIGGFLGFNAYDGFSAASLLGPTAGMINGMWKMGESLTQEHDVRKALASGGPTGIRNIAKALDQELPASGDSQLGTAFGFRSTQARKEIEFERIAKMRNEKAAREISHAARRVQENLGRGSAVVQQIVMAEAKKLVETESPQELKQVVSKIGSKVRQYEEEKRFPQDLREVGSTGQSAQLGNLARSMGVQLPQSQEVAREVMKSQLYQMMGMPYRSRVKDALQRDLATEREPWQMR